MSDTIQDIQEELSADDRFEVEITDEEILRIQSDEFAELPFGVPDEVHVFQTENGKFEARPVGGGGERFELSYDNALHYITESLTQ